MALSPIHTFVSARSSLALRGNPNPISTAPSVTSVPLSLGATLSRLLLGRRQPRSIPVSDRFLPHPHLLGLFDGCSEVQDLRYPIPTIPVPREAEMGDVMGKD